MRPEIWIGTVEISYFDLGKPGTRENAFTVVTTWACNADEFTENTERMLDSYGWTLLGVERSNPASVAHDYCDEAKNMLEGTRVKMPSSLYTYP